MGARVFPKVGVQTGEDTWAKLGFKEGGRGRSKGNRRAENWQKMGRIGVGWGGVGLGLHLASANWSFPRLGRWRETTETR